MPSTTSALHVGPWPRSSRCGPNVRGPRAQRRALRLIRFSLRMHVPERSRPTYVCMLCSSLCILFGLHAVPHWCDLQISSPPSVRKGTDPDSAIIQRKCRRYKRNARWRSSSGVPSLDGTSRRHPSTARPLDLPQRALGRAHTRADSIRYGHLLDLHVFVHLLVDAHRPRAASALAWKTAMRTALAAAFPLFAWADVPRSWDRRRDAVLNWADDCGGTTSVCASISQSSALPLRYFRHFYYFLYFHHHRHQLHQYHTIK